MLCIWISDRLDVFSSPPADSLGYHSGFICRSARLCFMEAARTQRSIQTEWEREREGTETRLPHERQLLVCMMDVSGYNLIEHVYPCMCGREPRLSCLSVYFDVYCIQVQDCVCARLHLQQYFNVVYDGNKRLQLCYRGRGVYVSALRRVFLRLRKSVKCFIKVRWQVVIFIVTLHLHSQRNGFEMKQ